MNTRIFQACEVIAVPDVRLQEKACACISVRPGKSPITMESLKKFLYEKGLAKQYWPEQLEIMDDFPRTPSGKIQKFRLREMINEKIQDKI